MMTLSQYLCLSILYYQVRQAIQYQYKNPSKTTTTTLLHYSTSEPQHHSNLAPYHCSMQHHSTAALLQSIRSRALIQTEIATPFRPLVLFLSWLRAISMFTSQKTQLIFLPESCISFILLFSQSKCEIVYLMLSKGFLQFS